MAELNIMMPGNPRNQPKELVPFFGYDYLYHGPIEVEIATVQTLAEIGIVPEEEINLLTPVVIDELLAITTSEVDQTERTVTQHDIRALVREMQKRLDAALARWLHMPLTSYDPLDTGRILHFLRAYQRAIQPAACAVVKLLAKKIRTHAGTLQIARTHGKHALPITVGFWLATILNRILYNLEKIDGFAAELVGKISGAVGAHNAQFGLGIAEKCGDKSFEERVLEKLGLKPARISTQILPPEPLAYFLFASTMLSAALAQLGRDGRQLMRSEIEEIAEGFEAQQVGSSAMPHKRNPKDLENTEGQWLRTKNEFGKVLDTLNTDHQRDLVGSCVARDFPIILVNLQYQLNTLLRRDKKTNRTFLERLSVDEEACRRNFKMEAHLILSEPLYIALQMAGYKGDAHELVNRRLVPIAQQRKILLVQVLEEMAETDTDIADAWAKIPAEVVELLYHPENYTGDASVKASEIADLADEYCRKWEE